MPLASTHQELLNVSQHFAMHVKIRAEDRDNKTGSCKNNPGKEKRTHPFA
jgi:hypothetical protein